MAYEKQTWQDNVSVLSAERFNHMEDGIDDGVKSLRIPGITIETGVSHGDFIYPVVANDQEIWKLDDSAEKISGRFICGEVNANTADAVRMGIMAMPAALIASLSQAEIDARYSLYVQSDGNLGLGVTSIHAGFILNDTEMIVDFNPVNAKPKAYTDNMIKFYAVPGGAGEMWLKIEKPVAADGVEIYRSTSAYAGEGRGNWGTQVVDITDDSDYKDTNEWFVDDNGGSNLSNGVTYYYKAFPYIGSVYNETSGSNETECLAGTMLNFWAFDDVKLNGTPVTGISGSIAVDVVSGNNASLSNQMVSAVKVGNGIVGAGAGVASITQINMAGKTILMYVKTNGSNSGFFGYSSYDGVKMYSGGNTLYGGSYAYVETVISDASSGHWVECYVSSKALQKFYIDGIFAVDASNGDPSSNTILNRIGYTALYPSGSRSQNGDIDNVRIFNGQLTAAARANLIQGGAGC